MRGDGHDYKTFNKQEECRIEEKCRESERERKDTTVHQNINRQQREGREVEKAGVGVDKQQHTP